jgi:hypothetical protein
MVEECQSNKEIEELIRECEVPIGYQQQERHHEWIMRMLREERENKCK